MSTPIKLSKGERLQMLVTAKSDGVAITLNNAYQVDAWIAGKTNGRPPETLGPEITGEGKIWIDFDTVNLAKGSYQLDIRITSAVTTDQWSEKIEVEIDSTITPPSQR